MPVQKAYRRYDPAPATAIGNQWSNSFDVFPTLGQNGDFLFIATLRPGLGDTTSSGVGNAVGYWSYSIDQGHSLHYRSGTEDVPGLPGVKFGLMVAIGAQNAQGRTLFQNYLMSETTNIPVVTSQSLWLGSIDPSQPAQLIARARVTPVPGAPPDALFNRFPTADSSQSFSLNSHNQVAFVASLLEGVGGVTRDNNRGIYYIDSNGSLNNLVRSYDHVALGNWRFDYFNSVLINDQGKIAFDASTTWPSTNGVWITDQTYQVKNVAIADVSVTPIPNASSVAKYNDMRLVAMNSMGHLLIMGDYQDQPNQINRGKILWCYDSLRDELIPIVQTGQLSDTGTGIVRKVNEIVIDNDFLL